jgi:hypothetical protein
MRTEVGRKDELPLLSDVLGISVLYAVLDPRVRYH